MELLFDRMLRERHNEGLQQGRDLGLQQGRNQGLVEGTRRTLLRQLELRFGALPESVRQHIETCGSLEQLEMWADRVVRAQSLGELGLGG